MATQIVKASFANTNCSYMLNTKDKKLKNRLVQMKLAHVIGRSHTRPFLWSLGVSKDCVTRVCVEARISVPSEYKEDT